MSDAEKEMNRGLTALFITVDAPVAEHVNRLVRACIAEKDAEIARLSAEQEKMSAALAICDRNAKHIKHSHTKLRDGLLDPSLFAAWVDDCAREIHEVASALPSPPAKEG